MSWKRFVELRGDAAELGQARPWDGRKVVVLIVVSDLRDQRGVFRGEAKELRCDTRCSTAD